MGKRWVLSLLVAMAWGCALASNSRVIQAASGLARIVATSGSDDSNGRRSRYGAYCRCRDSPAAKRTEGEVSVYDKD